MLPFVSKMFKETDIVNEQIEKKIEHFYDIRKIYFILKFLIYVL